MSIFSDAATVLFADANLSEPALLAPVAGAGVAVRVILGQEPVVVSEFASALEYQHTLSFRLAECQPGRGDTVTFDADTIYRLDGVVPGGDDGVVRRLYALRVLPEAVRLLTANDEPLVTADSDYLMAV